MTNIELNYIGINKEDSKIMNFTTGAGSLTVSPGGFYYDKMGNRFKYEPEYLDPEILNDDFESKYSWYMSLKDIDIYISSTHLEKVKKENEANEKLFLEKQKEINAVEQNPAKIFMFQKLLNLLK